MIFSLKAFKEANKGISQKVKLLTVNVNENAEVDIDVSLLARQLTHRPNQQLNNMLSWKQRQSLAHLACQDWAERTAEAERGQLSLRCPKMTAEEKPTHVIDVTWCFFFSCGDTQS